MGFRPVCDGCGGEGIVGGELFARAEVSMGGRRPVVVETCSPGCLGGLLSKLAGELPPPDWREVRHARVARLEILKQGGVLDHFTTELTTGDDTKGGP